MVVGLPVSVGPAVHESRTFVAGYFFSNCSVVFLLPLLLCLRTLRNYSFYYPERYQNNALELDGLLSQKIALVLLFTDEISVLYDNTGTDVRLIF